MNRRIITEVRCFSAEFRRQLFDFLEVMSKDSGGITLWSKDAADLTYIIRQA